MRIIDSIEVFNLPHVNNHRINLQEGDEHLILTGLNGTGKSSILRSLSCGGNHEINIISSIQEFDIFAWDRIAITDSESLLEMFKGKPTILVIDDMEVGLDLMQQRTLVKDISTRYPNVQIIGSTHSPFILAGAPKTSAYSLDYGKVYTDLEHMGIAEIADCLFGIC